MTRAKRLDAIQKEVKTLVNELGVLVDEEAIYLYRLARKAAKHQCTDELVNELCYEAEALRTSLKAAPEQCLNNDLRIQFKHAFRGTQ